MPEPQERTYIDQNTLLGALRTGTTTIVTPPVSPVPGHPQHQSPLERLTDLEIRNLEITFDGDINFETDSNSELQGTSNFPNNTLPLWEPLDREDWQQNLQKPKQKKKSRRQSWSFSTDNAFLNFKVSTYNFNPPPRPRGRLRTDTREDILDLYDADNEQVPRTSTPVKDDTYDCNTPGPRTSTPTKFGTYWSSQDIETGRRRSHRIRQQ